MRIVVNDIAASTGGAMTVLRDFYHCVCENDHENQWIFLLADRYFEETDNVKIIPMSRIKKSGLRKFVFDHITGRRFIGNLKPDAVLSLQNIITYGVKAPQAVYIHQSIPFQDVKRFSFLKSTERKIAVIQHIIGRIIKRSAKKSDFVLVQTRWIKDAICRKCHISPDKIKVVLPAVCIGDVKTTEFTASAFFYPTANQINKDNPCLIEASALLGREGIKHQVTMTLPAEKSIGSVRCIGRIAYEQVLQYYSCSTLVFPSYIETFGYPLAEARQTGAIVLASDCPFSREVLDGYENAYYFDPFQPLQLKELMKQVATGQITKKPVEAPAEIAPDSWLTVMQTVVDMRKK